MKGKSSFDPLHRKKYKVNTFIIIFLYLQINRLFFLTVRTLGLLTSLTGLMSTVIDSHYWSARLETILTQVSSAGFGTFLTKHFLLFLRKWLNVYHVENTFFIHTYMDNKGKYSIHTIEIIQKNCKNPYPYRIFIF